MRTVLHVLACALALPLAAPPACADPPAPPEDRTYSSGPLGDKLVAAARYMAEDGFSGAVLAARDGRVLCAVGVGMADAAKKVENTPATLFEIASLTKSFTAAATLRLAQRNPPALRLTDPIAKHLPGIPDDCKAITVEHLLRHTSGIPGSNAHGAGDDLTKVIPTFLKGGPQHPPGTHFEYWNQGYALLTEIIAPASGAPYTELCKKELFAPMGMTRTCFTGDPAPEGASVATGRSQRGPDRSALEHPYGGYGLQYRGMGGIVTSVWDLWRYDRALHDAEHGKPGAVLTPASVEALFKPGPGGYGLGWQIGKDADGKPVHSHGGGVRGFICMMKRYPARDAVLIVLCNDDAAPLGEAFRRLEDTMLEVHDGTLPPRRPKAAEPAVRPAVAVDGALLKALAGSYTDRLGNTLVIDPDGAARLTWSAVKHGQGKAAPVTRGTIKQGEAGPGAVVFSDSSSDAPMKIARDGDGPATSVTILGMTFERDKP